MQLAVATEPVQAPLTEPTLRRKFEEADQAKARIRKGLDVAHWTTPSYPPTLQFSFLDTQLFSSPS